jgi:Protein of unknown function (DUF2934)
MKNLRTSQTKSIAEEPLMPAPTAGAVEPGMSERHRRIAEAAYLRAAARKFVGGDPVQDWLEAERDLDASSDDESAKGR